MEMIVTGMIARAEHRLMVERAAQPWRRMEPTGRGRTRVAGLLARVRAFVARPRPALPERAGTAG